MLIATDLGLYDQGEVAGGCDAGADFICGPRGGIVSCRPCDYAQLSAFTNLQREANNLVHALKLNTSPAVIDGSNSCKGGYILAIDGRVGPCTVRTISELVLNKTGKVLVPSAMFARENFERSQTFVARYATELLAYLQKVAGIANAPQNVPAPAQQPIEGKTGAPGTIPPDGTMSTDPLPYLGPRMKTGTKVAIGLLAAGVAAGLVTGGVYYYRQYA